LECSKEVMLPYSSLLCVKTSVTKTFIWILILLTVMWLLINLNRYSQESMLLKFVIIVFVSGIPSKTVGLMNVISAGMA
jgi:hypothetical protein